MIDKTKYISSREDFLQFVRYLAVGVVNTFTGYGIIFGCMYLLGMGPLVSNAIGYGVGIIVSYSINKRFTFKKKNNDRSTFFRFLLATGLAYLANLLTLVIAIRGFGAHEGLAQVIAGSVYVATAFLVSKFYVFSTPPVAGSGEKDGNSAAN